MGNYNFKLIENLVEETIKHLAKSDGEIEKTCWMIVHQYHHGTMPFEYDIRQIDEDLYLEVLENVKERLGR